MGHEILTDEMSRFLTTVTIEVNKSVKKLFVETGCTLTFWQCRLQGDYNSEVKRLAARRDKLEKEYASRYNPDPDPTGTVSEPKTLVLYIPLHIKGSYIHCEIAIIPAVIN